MSLARTQSLLTRGANAGVCLRGMLDEEIAAQTPAAAAYRLQGEDVLLPPKAAEVLSWRSTSWRAMPCGMAH